MTEAQDAAMLEVEAALVDDPDDDVQVTAIGMIVKGSVFAYRSDQGDLVIDLPTDRADELVERGVAARHEGELTPKGAWVAVSDPEDWVEMATEAHQFVGEPAVGKGS